VVSASDDETVRVWYAEAGEEVRRLEGHTDFVRSTSFSSDGRHVVSASGDCKTVRVWYAETGEEVRRLEGHTGRVRSASFSSDRRYVVSVSWDKTVRVWDLTCRASWALADAMEGTAAGDVRRAGEFAHVP